MNELKKSPSLFMMVALSTTIFAFPAFARQAEDSPMMKAYREKRFDEFKCLAISADVMSLERYLEMAVNQQCREYADVLISLMPEGWNADELAEKMMARRNFRSLRYFLPYTTSSRHAGWRQEAINGGDGELAGYLAGYLEQIM